MGFYNILAENPIREDLVTMGYYGEEGGLATSEHSVIEITSKGVITSSGRFYPFKEAHPVYLQFLAEVNKQENCFIAYRWKPIEPERRILIGEGGKTREEELNSKLFCANIYNKKNQIQKTQVTFDYTSDQKTEVMLGGYSKELASKVVLSTFSPKMCLKLGIPKSVEEQMQQTSVITRKELKAKIHEIEALFPEKRKSISVIPN